MTERIIADAAVIDNHRDLRPEEVAPDRRSRRSQTSAAIAANDAGAQTGRALAAIRREASAQYEQVASMNSALREENTSLRNEAQRLTVALQSAEVERDSADRELGRARQLLQARTEELAAIQSVLGRVDQLSERDVVRKVEELNEEVFQLSALMADSLEPSASDRQDRERVSEAKDAVFDRLGEVVYGALKVNDDALRQAAVQVALQATAAKWSGSVVGRWSLGAEGYAAAARWKSVTRQSIREAERVTDQALKDGLHATMQTVLDASGYKISGEQINGSTDASAINEAVEAVVRLSTALRGDISAITSTELEIRLSRPGDLYDDTVMEADEESRCGSPVACGVSLGIARTSRGSETRALLKSKVVLVSAFASPRDN
ncbi:uncharacterized protein SCHCODRAFT_02570849 [Schizophyllum commune H4-8]|uniref:Uncharacterized protein n=1 Tax=Schizophyllum commune (strain H4-8 / FGSC 9210) TaxID=578458 RepID=D8PYA2_SCHCM|nr:uncharacterized protein SCHCODRAFT_02570849 [Schizophyllum commune H4-8]KAI5897241.1 hypothetical protein SCHCODRAFT_02570849 [Schizophyllum commune H4-8]